MWNTITLTNYCLKAAKNCCNISNTTKFTILIFGKVRNSNLSKHQENEAEVHNTIVNPIMLANHQANRHAIKYKNAFRNHYEVSKHFEMMLDNQRNIEDLYLCDIIQLLIWNSYCELRILQADEKHIVAHLEIQQSYGDNDLSPIVVSQTWKRAIFN